MNSTNPPAAEAGTRITEAAANPAVAGPPAKPPGRKRIPTRQPPARGNARSGRTTAVRPSGKLSAVPRASQVLSADALAYLEERELIIEKGKSATIATAVALFEIKQYKDADLLQGFHKSVAAYAEQRFGLKRAYVSLLLKSGELVLELRRLFATANKLPVSERQIRPLLKLEPGYRADVWSSIVATRESDQVTSKFVQEKVQERGRQLGLEWAKPVAPPAPPHSGPLTPPGNPEDRPSPTSGIPAVESTSRDAIASPPVSGLPCAKPGQHLDETIRAAIDYLDSVTVNHRRSVEWGALITKCRRTLEY